MGDGACAIHSVFGERTEGGYYHARAREFMRRRFGETAEFFKNRLNDGDLARELEHTLWLELVKPMAVNGTKPAEAAVNASNESRLVWREIVRNQSLQQACKQAV